MSDPEPQVGWRDAETRVALGLCAALALVVVVRALALGGEYYDAYETRMGGRVLAGLAEGTVPVYRSPLLLAASAVFERLGVGWRAPALLSALGYAALIGLTVALARGLGAKPWVAAGCGALVALDRLAFAYAPHGLPGVLAAAACGGALLLALRLDDGLTWQRALGLGALIGVAALLRPNAGLVGLALLAGLGPARGRPLGELPLVRLAVAGGVAVALYLLVTTGVHALARGSLGAGWAAHADLRAFHAAQLAENWARYGSQAPAGAYLLALAVAAPLLVALAPCGALLGRATRPVRLLAAWVLIHLGFVHTVPGHVEARYLLPALPALGALAAPALGWVDARCRAPAQRVAVVVALIALPLALGGRYEARRVLDPVTRHAFPARLADAVEAARGPEGRVLWTTTHLYPVAPAVVLAGSPYPGDPFHGIYHLGPVVLRYHLRRPVTMLADAGAGLVEREALQVFVREAAGFRPGDVLVVGRDSLSAHRHLAERPPGPLRVLPLGPGLTLREGRALVPGVADPDNPR